MLCCAAMKLRFAPALLLAVACAGSPAPAPAPAPTPSPTPEPPPGPTATGSGNCTGPAPGPGFECVQDCGPPVAQASDPPPGYSWLSAADAKSRKSFGCPICLPGGTLIDTPDGPRAVSELRRGDRIDTFDRSGKRITGHVLVAGSTRVSGRHLTVRLTLADGRTVSASPGHPAVDGRRVGSLGVGDPLAGSHVTRIETVPLSGDRTYDVLPSGPTGAYVADGVVLGSSFAR